MFVDYSWNGSAVALSVCAGLLQRLNVAKPAEQVACFATCRVEVAMVDSGDDFKGSAEPGSTDSSLVRELKSEDASGWRRFSRQYGPLVYRWCRRSGLQPADSADLVQAVFQSVLSGIERFEKTAPSHSLRAWLRTITSNRISEFHRRSKKHLTLPDGSDLGDWLHIDPSLNGVRLVSDETDENLAKLRRALQLLHQESPDATWHAFQLLAFEQQTSRQVGKKLQMSPASVRVLKSRMLRRLREILEQDNA